jgi:hypothetical protein
MASRAYISMLCTLLLACLFAASSAQRASVVYSSKPFTTLDPAFHSSFPHRHHFQFVHDDAHVNANNVRVAHGEFHSLTQTNSGWAELFVNATYDTAQLLEDEDVMFAAGYMEV